MKAHSITYLTPDGRWASIDAAPDDLATCLNWLREFGNEVAMIDGRWVKEIKEQ